MGLKKDLVTSSGISVKDAYYNIGSFSGNNGTVNFTMNAYINRQAFLEGKSSVDTSSFSFTMDHSDNAPNLFRQVYAFVKTIDDYTEAEDVLEVGQSPL